ncbi:hypothetical protein AQ883_15385 [Burkholderia pseudomallei]|nr:hypothetical protein BFR05_03530 [Burkholderia pseudomallei]EMP76229.1 hypothetical protein D512_16696 [Burkholderia pseudomallei MSHR1043]KEO67683.1 hypothetical protein J103_20610 [Burkholderia pseudomallei MSHR5855]APF97039.1 hypothetical protein BFR06_03540 [Burkholderia pseudomallei]OMZ44098.1 hypothetical protein AQ863_11105 [Burkholderia pseudomallei]
MRGRPSWRTPRVPRARRSRGTRGEAFARWACLRRSARTIALAVHGECGECGACSEGANCIARDARVDRCRQWRVARRPPRDGDRVPQLDRRSSSVEVRASRFKR